MSSNTKKNKDEEDIRIVIKSTRGKILGSNTTEQEKDEPKSKSKAKSPPKNKAPDDRKQAESLDWDRQPIEPTPRQQKNPMLKSQQNEISSHHYSQLNLKKNGNNHHKKKRSMVENMLDSHKASKQSL